MVTSLRPTQLEASVVLDAAAVRAEVIDRRLDAVELFTQLSEAQQEQLALDAWSIGLRALRNAHVQAQEARLADVGASLLEDLDGQLKAHVEEQQRTIASVLAKYFDPSDGQVSQRLQTFVADEGTLAQLLDRHVGPQNSVLAETLARQVGERSDLFRKLSSTESDGLVKVLERQLREVMDQGHSELVKALDPLAEDGAVARFLRSLREELKSADEGRTDQLAKATAALDANDENSLLSRLVRETAHARQTLLQAVNPDAPDSPMAALKATLTAVVNEHAASQQELLREQRERQEKLEKEIREALARLETRRAEDKRGPRGGLDFEDAVIEFTAAALRGAPCALETTGTTTGLRSRSKKGDAVARFTGESAFDGVGVVFEAKQDASYTVQRALAELDEARANRDATAGVFVMAESHAPSAFPRFARFGQNVLVTWNESNPATDSYLHAAILLGLGLVTRARAVGDGGNISALRDVEGRIEDEVRRLERFEKSNDQIRKHSDTIGDEVRKGKQQLDLLLRKAKETLKALNIQLLDEGAERETPISLPNGSLENASTALEASGGEFARFEDPPALSTDGG
jgi:hypothetical protein